MNLNLHTIKHSQQRYPTVGDWIVDNSNVPAFTILVSDMRNRDYEFLVMLHEMVEVYLCWKRGIKQEDVDAFDKNYEAKRPEGDFSEPGDSKRAPYYREHQFATKLERLMAREMGIAWDTYNNTVEQL